MKKPISRRELKPSKLSNCVFRTFHPLAGAIAAILMVSFAATTAAASHEYFVHGEAYNPLGGGYQPSNITIDWLNGDPLVVPEDACGMRFEGDNEMHWISNNYDLEDSILTGGAANVWLPSDDCGSWQGITVETDGGDTYIPPFDFSGRIETYATGYWINKNGQKLVYLYQPCSPMPKCILGSQTFVANGWSNALRNPIRELVILQSALVRGDSAAMKLITRVSDALNIALRTTAERVKYRRRINTGHLERSMRQVEDIALTSIADAQRSVGACRKELEFGNRDAAYRVCNEAFRKVQSARVALDTGDAWIE